MARKQELCQTLNMNFDEANELFSTETLSSMTMAKVNGGAAVTGLVLAVLAGVITHYIIKWSDGTETTPSQNQVQMKDTGEIIIDGRTMVAYSVDTVGNNVTYTKTFRLKDSEVTPTPTPTPGWHPPML